MVDSLAFRAAVAVLEHSDPNRPVAQVTRAVFTELNEAIALLRDAAPRGAAEFLARHTEAPYGRT